MKIALLSHRGGNIGHEFMSVGMSHILNETFGSELEIVHFEQHRHFEVNPAWHPVRLMHFVPHGRMRTLRKFLSKRSTRQVLWSQTKPLDFSLAVAAGGPNIVRNVTRAPEMSLMMHYLNGAFHIKGVPFVDAGVGSAFPYLSADQRLIASEDIQFYKEASNYCSRITVRERVAQKTFVDIGVKTDLIPCGALAAGKVMRQLASCQPKDQFVLVNFQAFGANEDWGQGVDCVEWRRVVTDVVTRLNVRHKIVFLAHSDAEAINALGLLPNAVVFRPKSITEYAQVIAGAKVGFVSRIHAAIPLAGMGVPSLVVGTDTRLGTVETIGLPTLFVKNAVPSEIIASLEHLIENRVIEKQRLLSVTEETIKSYASVFQSYVLV
jgi:polysaccharide pyruvyl transferase WcaK-like protein